MTGLHVHGAWGHLASLLVSSALYMYPSGQKILVYFISHLLHAELILGVFSLSKCLMLLLFSIFPVIPGGYLSKTHWVSYKNNHPKI